MNTDATRKFFNACMEARRIVNLLPELPEGMRSAHIYVLDTLAQLQRSKKEVRISDIGCALHVTNPNMTRIINDLVKMKTIKKVQSDKDRRVFTIRLTALGEEYQKKYSEDYHNILASKFAGITEEDVETTARVIHEAYRIMSDGHMEIG